MDPNILKRLNSECRNGRSCVRVTYLIDGRDRLICEDQKDQITGTLGEAIREAFQTRKSVVLNIEGRDFLINFHEPY